VTLSDLEVECLDAVADDYENLEIISGMVSGAIGRVPEEKELLDCLSKLKTLGLIKFYGNPNGPEELDSIPDKRDGWNFSALIPPEGVRVLHSAPND
jgi:hypothetical protein